jgi:myoferlin
MKSQDFQIRIKVIQARQLDGNNIHPICRIKCFNIYKNTKIMRSTNSPFWNEVFFFNFHQSPAELFDQPIEFQVYNSLKY